MEAHVEMREHVRRPVELAASVSDGVIETPAQSIDASRSGVGLRSAWLWHPGTLVTVRLNGAHGTAVARAVVSRSEGDVMGLSLIAQGPAFARVLRSLATA